MRAYSSPQPQPPSAHTALQVSPCQPHVSRTQTQTIYKVEMSSLDTNPPNAPIHVSTHGTDWLWAVFALMTVAMLGMFVMTHMRPRGTRFFHNIALIILTVSAIAYFAMASDLGATPIQTEFRASGARQIWYVRYIQWFINFPLLLVLILTTTGLAMSDILQTAFFAWVVVVTGLVGALTSTSYKWGFYVFGLYALFHIWTMLWAHGHRTIFNAGAGMRTGYGRGAGWVTFITLLYPICWACSEGGNVISVTSEMVWYGILDLLLGPIFLYYFIWSLRAVDYAAFGLQSLKYTDTTYGSAYGAAAGPGVVAPTTRAKEAEATGVGHAGVVPGAAPGIVPVGPTTGAAV